MTQHHTTTTTATTIHVTATATLSARAALPPGDEIDLPERRGENEDVADWVSLHGHPDQLATASRLAHPTAAAAAASPTSIHYTLRETHATPAPAPAATPEAEHSVRGPIFENFPMRRDLADDLRPHDPRPRWRPTGRSVPTASAAAAAVAVTDVDTEADIMRAFSDHAFLSDCHDPLADPSRCSLVAAADAADVVASSSSPSARQQAAQALLSHRRVHALPLALACASIVMLLVAVAVSARLFVRRRSRRRAGPLSRAAGVNRELAVALGGGGGGGAAAAQGTPGKVVDGGRVKEEV